MVARRECGDELNLWGNAPFHEGSSTTLICGGAPGGGATPGINGGANCRGEYERARTNLYSLWNGVGCSCATLRGATGGVGPNV